MAGASTVPSTPRVICAPVISLTYSLSFIRVLTKQNGEVDRKISRQDAFEDEGILGRWNVQVFKTARSELYRVIDMTQMLDFVRAAD